jgi:hypothetical protein
MPPRPDHALDAGLAGDPPIDQQVRRLDAERVARHAAEALDVMRAGRLVAAALVDAADAEVSKTKTSPRFGLRK